MKTPSPNSVRMVVGAVLAAVLIIGAGLALLLPLGPAVSEQLEPLVDRYQGSSAVGAPWSLTDMDGQTITQAAPEGTVTVLFFGFTHCPDICPTALLTVGQALDRLTPEQVARVRPVFISLDPERDDGEVLSGYVSLFHPALIGASGDPATLAEMVKDFRGYYRKVPLEGEDYTVDHTTFIYLMDAEGRNLGILNHASTSEELATALAAFLQAMES